MKHALFVAFQYPPDGSSSGVLRALKYTQYLADFGWRVTVVAPAVSAYAHLDAGLLAQVPDSVRVVRTPVLNSKRHFGVLGRYPALLALPDVWIGWLPFALRAALRTAASDPVDLVYSTSPPATSHLVGGLIARRLRRPWVADFRDPWFEDPPEPGAPAGPVFRAIDRRLERRVVTSASHVLATTEHLRAELASRYPERSARITALPNGYDEADFAGFARADATRGERFEILHAGSINPQFRDPIPLLKAIRRAADQGLLDLARLRLRFLGGGAYAESALLADAVARLGLVENVAFVPRVEYAEALAAAAAADLLLLLQASDDSRGLVPAKLYEYLRMGKPVLALVLPGAVSDVLHTAGGGAALDPADAERLQAEVVRLYRAWQDGTLVRLAADPDRVRRYDRRELTRALAALFDRVTQAADAG